MIKPQDVQLANEIKNKLLAFNELHEMPGISSEDNLNCLVNQIIDSIRRIKYVKLLRNRIADENCVNPNLQSFDPIKAAIWYSQNGNISEALWLTFLITHFGRNKTTKWELLRNVYNRLGDGVWTWDEVYNNQQEFENWLRDNSVEIKQLGKFGNHRKYESLKKNTFNTIKSYIDWAGANPIIKFNQISDAINDPKGKFDTIYNSLDTIYRFGRMAKFDFLAMVGKIGILEIVPPTTYMDGATGPYFGSCLLFAGDINTHLAKNEIDNLLGELEVMLDLDFGMQVLEDAICNWQKSPSQYIYFSG